MRNRRIRQIWAVFLGALLAGTLGCSGSGGGGGGGDKQATGEGPCESADECAGDVCVAIIDGNNPPVYCTEPCGSCPDGLYCDSDTFALVDLAFCRFGDTPNGPAPTPEEPPRLPCTSDASCEPGLVCATFMGERECTLPCVVEDDCTVELGGVTINFSTCAADQTAGESRDVCLPDPACFPDPTGCIALPF